MAELRQDAVLTGAYALMFLHMFSVLAWLGLCVREVRRQQARAAIAKLSSVSPITDVWEHWGVRVFLVYALSDLVRNMDLSMDFTDDIYRALFSFNPLGCKVSAWWVRDAALFGGTMILAEIYLGWLYRALGREVPKTLTVLCPLLSVVSVLAFGVNMAFALSSNRLVWVLGAGMSFVPVNFVLAGVNGFVIFKLLPQLQQPASKVGDDVVLNMLMRAKLTFGMMLAFNVVYALGMPVIIVDKLAKDGFTSPILMDRPVNTSLWAVPASLAADLPAGVRPVLAHEFVELTLGWLCSIVCVGLSKGYTLCEAARSLRPKPSDAQYLGTKAIGDDIRLRLGLHISKPVDKKLK
eukprot:TRINITY_DN80454_c0_g1_i1.p1 TRINITY_DN80454_c0_g1~~TRINITY_DN80454_c0_g1_i1.p1  ORF type:complete len:351 (-),score=67.31 TRINITY_DN80454_c0_g1_i1:356-1408(-)